MVKDGEDWHGAENDQVQKLVLIEGNLKIVDRKTTKR